jgi:radical SAM-linked protein
VRLALHAIDASYLEAALARGDESLGMVIEEAWRRGARFDSWTEELRRDAWAEAFATLGETPERLATTPLDPSGPLPWDVVTGTVHRDFLWAEWEKAWRGETTGDCRWEECSGCGVCGDTLRNDLAASGPRESLQRTRWAPDDRRVAGVGGEGRRFCYLATFSVSGRGRFLGHLDRAELLRRAVRRAGGRLALSAGMRPKARLSLALPLAVGMESRCELVEFELAEEADDGFFERLERSLPGHIRLLGLEPYTGRRSVAARVERAAYEVEVRVRTSSGGDPGRAVYEACERFSLEPVLMVEEARDDVSTRQVDVRLYVDQVRATEGDDGAQILSFATRVSPTGSTRPERVVEALAALGGVDLGIARVTRTRIDLTADER